MKQIDLKQTSAIGQTTSRIMVDADDRYIPPNKLSEMMSDLKALRWIMTAFKYRIITWTK